MRRKIAVRKKSSVRRINRKSIRAPRRKQIAFSHQLGTPLKSLAKTQAALPASLQKLINEHCILFNNMLSIMSVL